MVQCSVAKPAKRFRWMNRQRNQGHLSRRPGVSWALPVVVLACGLASPPMRNLLLSSVSVLCLVASFASCARSQAKPTVQAPRPAAAPISKGKAYGQPLPPGSKALRPVDPATLPPFDTTALDRSAMLVGIAYSRSWLMSPGAKKSFPSPEGITLEQTLAGLRRFEELLKSGATDAMINQAIQQEFLVFESVGWNGAGEVLMTGYCTPIMNGRLQPDQEFRFPVYALPEDLMKNPDPQGISFQRQSDGSFLSYPSRQELEKTGKLQGVVWLRDAFDAYIVNIQGSAKIDLPDGTRLDLGYAGTNGHPYVSIGKILVQEGKIGRDEISLPRMKQYFATHPGEVEQLITKNPRLVFFQKSGGDALGCLGYPVTSGVSIATDKRIFPASALTFVRTTIPTLGGQPISYSGFRLDQDRGGAIDAPGRCDLYFGVGHQAEALAGQQLFEGKLYYLVLKDGGKTGGRLGKETGKVPTSRVP